MRQFIHFFKGMKCVKSATNQLDLGAFAYKGGDSCKDSLGFLYPILFAIIIVISTFSYGSSSISCLKGSFLNNEGKCTPCQGPRLYQDEDGQSFCKTVSAGYYLAVTGNTTCSVPTTSNFGDTLGQKTTQNIYYNEQLWTVSLTCNDNFILLAAGTHKSVCECPSGYELQGEGVFATCSPCINNTYNDVSNNKCKTCPDNKTNTGQANTTCEICSSGYYEKEGICTICPSTINVPENGTGIIPSPCDATKFTDFECNVHYVKKEDTCQRATCPEGEYLENGICVNCPGLIITPENGYGTNPSTCDETKFTDFECNSNFIKDVENKLCKCSDDRSVKTINGLTACWQQLNETDINADEIEYTETDLNTYTYKAKLKSCKNNYLLLEKDEIKHCKCPTFTVQKDLINMIKVEIIPEGFDKYYKEISGVCYERVEGVSEAIFKTKDTVLNEKTYKEEKFGCEKDYLFNDVYKTCTQKATGPSSKPDNLKNPHPKGLPNLRIKLNRPKPGGPNIKHPVNKRPQRQKAITRTGLTTNGIKTQIKAPIRTSGAGVVSRPNSGVPNIQIRPNVKPQGGGRPTVSRPNTGISVSRPSSNPASKPVSRPPSIKGGRSPQKINVKTMKIAR